MQPAALQLDLDTYDGPFDLLCTLLLRREVSVEDVPLAEIVVAYVERLAEQARVDPDTASEFLLLVAGLMEIKARELLAQEAELDIEDPASIEAQGDMLERLVRYATFRKAAEWLGAQGGRQRWWRVAPPARRRTGQYEGPVMDPALLQRSMTVLLAQPDVDVRHLVGRHASVSEMTGRLLSALRTKRTFSLEDTFTGLNRLDQAVAFIAALELCKNGHVELQQQDRFGPIIVSRREVASETGEQSDSEQSSSPAVAG
jgi:segregation and condensation protein A